MGARPRSGVHGWRALRKHGSKAGGCIAVVIVACLLLSAFAIIALRNVGKPMPQRNSQPVR